jgi:shikimate dehydrogenase
MTQSRQTLLGIIGCNIDYTLSPAMHNEAISTMHLPYAYGVFDVTLDLLPGLIDGIRKEHIRGVNVTIPHKQAVMPLLDTLSEEARAVGAVNTIVNNNGMLAGENTDVAGVHASLASHAHHIRGGNVVLLGAGGASRAVLYAVARFAPQSVRVYNRHAERAHHLIESFHDLFPAVHFTTIAPEELTSAVHDAVLIVNTTSIGMRPDFSAMPVPDRVRFSTQQIIFDIIYIPLQTALLRKAAAEGATVINGMEMFIQQGARAFTLWTGLPFPENEARECVRRELVKR